MAEKLSPCGMKVLQIYNISPKTIMEIDKITDDFIQSADRSEIFKAKNEIAEQLKLESDIKLNAAIDTISKVKSAINRIEHPSVATDPTQGLMSLLERTSSVVPGFGVSLEKIKESYGKIFRGKFATDLRKLNFESEFNSGAFDTAILDHMQFGKAYTGAMSDRVIAVAESLNTSYKMMLHEARSNGILTNEAKGYVGPIVHDRGLVGLTPANIWISDIANSLDLQKQFPLIPKVQIDQFTTMLRNGLDESSLKSDNSLLKIFKGSYDKIKGEEGSTYNFGYETIEQRRTAPRKFTAWKDGQSVQDYLNKYSKYKTLADRHAYYSGRMTSEIGKVAMFGPRPDSAIETILAATKTKLSDAGWALGDIKEAENNFKIQYDRLNGSALSEVSKLGEYYATVRKLSANAVLGKAGLTSAILDTLSMTIQKNTTWNDTLVPALFSSVFDRFGAIPSAIRDPFMEQKYLLQKNQLSASIQDIMEGAPSNKILNISNFISGVATFADFMNRNAHIAAMRSNLERLVRTDINKLHPRTQAILNKFNITQEHVDLLKNFHTKEMGMMEVNNATVNDIMRLRPELSTTQASNLLSDFKTKMNAFMIEETMDAAKRPDAWTYRKILRDSKEGTLEGETRRTLGQLKSTQIAAIRDFAPSNIRKVNYNMDQSLPITQYNTKNTYWYAGKFAASSLVAGMGLVYMNALLNRDDKKLQKFQKQDPSILVESAARGGLGFFLTDMLSQGDARARISGMAGPMASLIAGPMVDLFSEPFKEKHKPIKESIKLIRGITPASNHWLMKEFWDGIEHEFGEITSRKKNNLLE